MTNWHPNKILRQSGGIASPAETTPPPSSLHFLKARRMRMEVTHWVMVLQIHNRVY